ncbi:hypothetical protein LGH82_02935 [Mesorhizobium sp. PAMC28654]|uniref:hypothetical protein n=1 Tax=Mesorhizobium sp. PAMC28654 TaxID=2880934 RepID=UPI001D09B557|nr:hypothetical protein [Mesorhizobium sp. PAMC28654]UDL90353.1 hypothetical protein LGH82_02935 [Mesorhizobium sp. PAMC28654]
MHFAIDLAERPNAAEVSSFVILAPSGQFRTDKALRQVEAFLADRFPTLTFYANGDTPPFDGDYNIVPICGVPGKEPDSIRMLDYPPRSLMLAIDAALQGFRPTGLPVN